MPDNEPSVKLCWITVGRGFCDVPATHIYHGIGGDQPVCDEHAEWLRRRWGVRPELIRAAASGSTDVPKPPQ